MSNFDFQHLILKNFSNKHAMTKSCGYILSKKYNLLSTFHKKECLKSLFIRMNPNFVGSPSFQFKRLIWP